MNCDTMATKSKQWDIDSDGNTSYCCSDLAVKAK